MKVLIVRFSAMGDIILCSPVIRLLSEQLGAKVSFLTKLQNVDLLRGHPMLNEVYGFDDNWNELLPRLKSEGFDLIVDLHNNLRSHYLRKRLGVESLIVMKRTFEKWLFLKFGINRLSNSTVVDRHIGVLRSLGIQDDGNGLDFFLPEDIDISKEGFNSTKKKIAIVAGGTYVTKRISYELIRDIVLDDSYDYYILGGEDVDLGIQKIKSPHVRNYIGQISLQESASILREVEIVITGDTGLMHIAAAFQKAIIVIWGSTSPVFGFAPYYGANSVQEYKSICLNLPCQPCSKYGAEVCPKKHMNCLNGIEVAQIRKAISALIG